MKSNSSDVKTQNMVDKSLAQSGALAVQDAANNLREMNTLLSTASGVALANFIETGDVNYLKAIDDINSQAKNSTDHFINIFTRVYQSISSRNDGGSHG
ncbi:hypothetical protein [Photobacterium sp. 1_MG-2023]|uniref:hypothetical protein n=1 Tax=Photobacterium sp. 1_MG-2023 TaxID=3062646 RepID=UPI0026E199D5|nr:hypothetical protein [Photobacterium sp. 1_MG-2023]MDO6708354.1 hypothetical protein [Photobacterium sp. 1_MG-2023]